MPVIVLQDYLKSQWQENWGPRTEDLIRNLLLVLQANQSPLSAAVTLLTSASARQKALAKVADENVRLFWRHLNALKECEFNLWIESPRNKLNALTSNPYLKGVFDVWEPTINVFDIMTTGKVCPINLSRNHLKTDTRGLFGSLLLGILDLAIVQLEEIPEQDRKPVMIMVDECHEVWNSDACRSLLTGSRKFGIGLFVLTQSLANLPAADVDVLLGVIGNLGIFSCGRKDAERLVKEALHFPGEAVRDTATGRTFTPNEEVEAAIKQVMQAGRQEMLFKPRGKSPWFARTLRAEFPTMDPAKREEFIRESARIYWRKPEAKPQTAYRDRL